MREHRIPSAPIREEAECTVADLTVYRQRLAQGVPPAQARREAVRGGGEVGMPIRQEPPDPPVPTEYRTPGPETSPPGVPGSRERIAWFLDIGASVCVAVMALGFVLSLFVP